jgi:hypothetical protein
MTRRDPQDPLVISLTISLQNNVDKSCDAYVPGVPRPDGNNRDAKFAFAGAWCKPKDRMPFVISGGSLYQKYKWHCVGNACPREYLKAEIQRVGDNTFSITEEQEHQTDKKHVATFRVLDNGSLKAVDENAYDDNGHRMTKENEPHDRGFYYPLIDSDSHEFLPFLFSTRIHQMKWRSVSSGAPFWL